MIKAFKQCFSTSVGPSLRFQRLAPAVPLQEAWDVARGCLCFNQHPSCFCCGWSSDIRQRCPADALKASSVWDTGESGSGGRDYFDSYSSLLPFDGDFIPQSWVLPQSLWALETSQRYLGRDTAGHGCKTLQLGERRCNWGRVL